MDIGLANSKKSLREAWDEMILVLEEARNAIDQPNMMPPPANDRNLAEGYRYLMGFMHAAVERAFHNDIAIAISLVPLYICVVPTFVDSLRAVRKALLHKAVSESWLGGDVIRTALLEVALLCHPIRVKFAMCIRPVLQWIGGPVVGRAKRIGPNFDCNAFRDIIITHAVGKTLGKLLRSQLLGVVTHEALDTQWGKS